MITQFFLQIGLAIVMLILSLFPALPSFPTASDFMVVIPWWSWANGFLPLSDAVTALEFLVSVWGVCFAIRSFIWLYRLVPIVGGH